MWKRVETDNVRMVFVCPYCKKEHTRVICDDMVFTGAYRPACYICAPQNGVTCDFVSVEVKTAGKGEKSKYMH